MTRKERFLQVIKTKGYNSVVDLMIAVEAVILKDIKKAYEKATTCKNYYAMIEGKTRDFPKDYIVALETVLDMKYIDMINPDVETKPTLQYDSLRSIAFSNDYKKTKEFALKTANEEILFNSDEYNKFFIDYIIEYHAINCLKYIVESWNVKLNFNCNTICDDNHHLFTNRNHEELPIEIANLICEFDDVDLFNKIFDTFDYINYLQYDYKNIYEDENFAKSILKTNKILESLFETRELDIDKVNSVSCQSFERKGKYANTLLNTIIKVGMKDPIKYDEVLCKVLTKAFDINKDIVNYLKQYEEKFTIDDKGLVKVDWTIYGQVIKYKFPMLPETPSAIKKLILDIDKPLAELEAKESKRYGRRVFQVIDDKVYLPSSNNDTQYEMMRYMNKKQFSYIPHLYEHNKDSNVDIIEFKQPIETSFYYSIDKEQIVDIAKFLKEFHKLSEENLGKGKVYLHNNLLYSNCSFKDDILDAVTDWKDCSIGDPLNDILFVLLTWTGISSRIRVKGEVLDNIKLFVDNYKLDESIKLGNELNLYLNNKLKNLNKESDSFEENYEMIKFSLIFIELNQDRLNERSW